MNMSGSSHVLASAAAGFERHLALQGGDADSVLGNVGLRPEDLSEPTNLLSLPSYCSMLEKAAENAHAPNFGLDYGRDFEPERLGLIGFIALASPTAGSALKNFIDLFPLHQNGTETTISQDGDLLRMEYRILDSSIVRRRQDAEFTISLFANVAKRCLGKSYQPVRLDFEHPQPSSIRQHHNQFDADIAFSQRTNALVLRASRLDAPLATGNLELLDLLRCSLKSVACPAVKYDVATRARAEIRGRLAGGVSLSAIADALGLPTWSFQRRLAAEGLTFSKLVDTVRRDMTQDFIAERHIPLSEIAFLLGYSELSAFSRAFRGWHDVSPQRYRQIVLKH